MACSCFLAMSSMADFSSDTAALASALPSCAAFSSDSYFAFRLFSSVLATFTASTSSLISMLFLLPREGASKLIQCGLERGQFFLFCTRLTQAFDCDGSHAFRLAIGVTYLS